MEKQKKPRVFVCYAHDDAAHRCAVRELSWVLLRAGTDVRLDTWDEGRRRDWQHWAIRQITEADFVLIVASPVCRAVGDGTYDGIGHAGIHNELRVIRNILQQHRKWEPYLLPVVLPGESIDNLPLFLAPQIVDYFVIKKFTLDGVSELVAAMHATPRRAWPLR